MYTRRRALALGVAGMGALAGCSTASELAGDGPIKRTAAPAALSESAVSETEYQEEGQREQRFERTVNAGGQERTIVASNQITLYAKAVDQLSRGSLFGVVSTPGFTIAGTSLNPVGQMSNEDLLEFVSDEFGGISDVSKESTFESTVLGSKTEISKFGATRELGNQNVDMYIYAGKALNERNDEGKTDVVLGAGGYPKAFDDTESETIEGFFEEIEHPV